MAPKKYMRQMSTLPETATVRCHFTFALIGAKAHALASHVMEADLHVDTLEMLGGKERAFSRQFSNLSSTDSEPVGQRSSIDLKADEKGTWCMVDHTEMVVARIRFSYSEGWSESLPSGTITDTNSVRDTVFVFLADSRLDSGEVLSSLNSGFAEMDFMYRQVQEHAVAKIPTLRVVLLKHSKSRPGLSSETLTGALDDEALKLFASRLKDVSCSASLKQLMLQVDFDDSDGLYECIADIAKDLYRVNFKVDATTGRSAHWRSVRMSTFQMSSSQKSRSRARTCIIQ